MTSPLDTCSGCLFQIIYRILNFAIRTGEYYVSTVAGLLLLAESHNTVRFAQKQRGRIPGTKSHNHSPPGICCVFSLLLIYAFLKIVIDFYRVYFDQGFPSLYLFQIIPVFSLIQIHSFFHESKNKKNKNIHLRNKLII